MTRAMHQLTIVYNGYKSKFIDELDSELYIARTFETAVETELRKPTPLYQKRDMPAEAQSAVVSEQTKTETTKMEDTEKKESRKKRWSF